jgi:phospholipid/cholesterol/gamma-HCH transport system permease protein
VQRTLSEWWAVLLFGAVAAVYALSPSSHDARSRNAAARLLHATSWQALPWFALLSALISLALIRTLVVTAQSYGLSQFALEMVVRVLVLELVPLGAALFVLLRVALAGDLLPEADPAGGLTPHTLAADRWRLELVPRVLALGFAVLALATASGVLALVLAYTVVYGVTPWGLDAYTRMVGRVFDPAVCLALGLKTALFAIAVAVVPLASALQEPRAAARRAAGFAVRSGTRRVLAVLVLLQAASLALKFL